METLHSQGMADHENTNATAKPLEESIRAHERGHGHLVLPRLGPHFAMDLERRLRTEMVCGPQGAPGHQSDSQGTVREHTLEATVGQS